MGNITYHKTICSQAILSLIEKVLPMLRLNFIQSVMKIDGGGNITPLHLNKIV
jgi:hypothetical protein